MEGLSFDNIYTGSEIENLFNEDIQEDSTETVEDTPEKDEEKKEDTTEVNPNTLFEDSPESVSSEEDIIKEQESTSSEKGASPKFYSSIAKAFADDGIFPDLNEEDISKIETPEDFRTLIESKISSELDDRYKRIDKALGIGVEPDIIKQYEGALNYLESIQQSSIEDENEQGEELRKKLIYQDFINRGYSQERAQKEVDKSIKGGTDIEDAKEALQSNKDFYKTAYDKVLKDAEEAAEKSKKEQKEQIDTLKKSILEDKKFFGDLDIDRSTRQRVLDNILKPVHKDKNTGELYTAIQQYEMENKIDFIKNLGLIFTLTNGFKDLSGFIKGKVRKEVKRGISELENVLNNTQRTSDGNLNFMGGGKDPESFIGKGWTLDV